MMGQGGDVSLAAARRVIECEREGLKELAEAIDQSFADAVSAVMNAKGRVILAGVGKSGHVARKIAATLASTGTPSYYVHPSEASHGDLGMVSGDDVVVALSNSGETRELADLVGYCKRFGVVLIGMTSRRRSMLGESSDVKLILPPSAEACLQTRAPTTSTTMMMALGDALAVAVLEARGFSAEDFRVFHPGGTLGAALSRVQDVMHAREQAPLVSVHAPMSEALIEMSEKGFGCVGAVDDQGGLAGIVTDGDLRRHMNEGLLSARVEEVMTRDPKVAAKEQLAADALRVMTAESRRITVMFVVEDRKPIGVLHVHDLLRVGVA